MGLIAFLKACPYITRFSGNPLALAVTKYCVRKTSSILPRIIRCKTAMEPVEITITGTKRCFVICQNFPKKPMLAYSPEKSCPFGKIPHISAKKSKRSAKKKPGRESPIYETTEKTLSPKLY